MKKSKIQRMRNIVSGNYNSKTKISSGYTKKHKEHQEGDVWEERGKTWTIKNGIRQTVTKLDAAREYLKIPHTCPKCGDPRMNHPAYKAMYLRFGMCVNCVAKFERDLRAAGKWEEYRSALAKNENDAWLQDVTNEYYDWLSTDQNKYITEAGHIETWSGGQTKEELESEFHKEIDKVKKQLEQADGNSEGNS